MSQHFDIAVIGAGPAGSTAASAAAKAGKSVALFERNEQPGVPVRCGEGIGMRSLTAHSEARPEWILQQITGSRMIAPDGTRVSVADIDKSVILDRERMDGDLAKDAKNAGAHLFVKTAVTDIHQNNDLKYTLETVSGNIEAGLVILADGVESRLARKLGWNTRLAPNDIESCAFTRVTSPLIDQDACIFYVGSTVAPGGYAWIFPRAKGEANVGLGLSGTHSNAGAAKKYLMEFIDRELPGGKQGPLHCGGVPVTRYVRPLVRGGAMLVGDAARQVNCLSGAGIAYSLFAGNVAGTVAAQAHSSDSINYTHLKSYEKQWKIRYGKQQERSFVLKEFVTTHTDDSFLNTIAAKLVKKRSEKIRYLTVFLSTFSRHPLLMLKAFKLFG